MGRGAASCKHAMALVSTLSPALDVALWRRQSSSAACRLLTVAAAGGRPEPPRPAGGQPQQRAQHSAAPYRGYQQPPAAAAHQQQQQAPQHQQQQAPQGGQEYESIRRQWHVKRTELRHFPEEVQERIRRGPGGGSAGSSPQPRRALSSGTGSSSSMRGGGAAADAASAALAPAAAAAAGSRSGQAALAADLDKLQAALEYERRAGCVNVVGSVERVPVADWAARHLLAAAGQLQADPAAAHACVAAAQQLRRYAGMAQDARAGAVAAAENAARQALLSLQVGARLPAARQGRYQPPPPQASLQQQPLPPQQRQLDEGGAAPALLQGQQLQAPPAPTTAAAAAAASDLTAAQQQQQQEGPPASDPQPPPAQRLPAEDQLDVAAEEAHAEEVGQPVPTPQGEEYVMQGNRRIKAATAAFRRSFAEAAAALELAVEGGSPGVAAAAAAGEQRSAAWFRLRERRLTASAFSKALGLFEGDRQQLWGEKVGLVEPFAGNAATAWGTSAEPQALAAYEAMTGQRITSCMFQVKHDDPVHGWLGASPDGLIESLSLDPAPGPEGTSAASAGSQLPPAVAARVAHGRGPLAGAGRGILEIKCPFNKGQPELAAPPQHATWYYMPQVQGLMYIFDCEWCNLYIWTSQRGSAVYHIRRDRAYWARLWGVLADFWWNHVVPARQEFQAGRWEEVEQYRPSPRIEATEELRQRSKRMALDAPVTFFKPQPHAAAAPPAERQ